MSCKHRAGKIYAYSDLWDYMEAKVTPSANREREREREATESCSPSFRSAIKANLQQLLGKSTQIIQSLDPLQHLFIHLIHCITYIFLW